MCARLHQQCAASLGQIEMLYASVNGVCAARYEPRLFQIGNDDADGLRRQKGDAREIGIGMAGIGGKHGEDGKLRLGEWQISQCFFHAVTVGTCRLPQKIAKITLLATLALARFRQIGHRIVLAHNVKALICCSCFDIIASLCKRPVMSENQILNQPRVDYQSANRYAPNAFAALAALGKAVDDSGLEKELTELMKVRVSQINGCAFCVQYHLTLARKIGVASLKLDLVAVWRDAGVFSNREMAALAFAEDLTALQGHEPSHQAWSGVLEHFSESEAVFLTIAIGAINNWNRIGAGLGFAPVLLKAA